VYVGKANDGFGRRFLGVTFSGEVLKESMRCSLGELFRGKMPMWDYPRKVRLAKAEFLANVRKGDLGDWPALRDSHGATPDLFDLDATDAAA